MADEIKDKAGFLRFIEHRMAQCMGESALGGVHLENAWKEIANTFDIKFTLDDIKSEFFI